MKYFSLNSSDSVILKWSDDRTAEFTSNQGSEDEVEETVAEFETLRDSGIPIYTEKRLKFFFPDMREISEDEYTGMLASIDQYNAESAVMQKEADSKTEQELLSYISSFAVNNPRLLKFAEVSELVDAFNDALEEDILDLQEAGEEVDPQEEQLSYLKSLYIILRNVEKSSDPSLVRNILSVVRGA